MKSKKTGNPVQREKSIEKKRNRSHNVLMLCPDSAIHDNPTTCIVVLDAPLPDSEDFYIKFLHLAKTTVVRAEKVNETSLAFKTPGNFMPGEAKIVIHFGYEKTKLCSSSRAFLFKPKVEILCELLEATTDPMAFIASAYNLNEYDAVAVDLRLENALRSNAPENIDIMQTNDKNNNVVKTAWNVPTLLHFAARYNLVRLFVALLRYPGAQQALNMINKEGYTPCQLAEVRGFNHFSEILSSWNFKDKTLKSQSVDEIYEHMSPEINDRYSEAQKDYYEAMNAHSLNDEEDSETYEDMYSYRRESANSRSSIPVDRQSVYSSDSTFSSASNDSRSSGYGAQQDLNGPPDSRRVKPLSPFLHPLINELKRKTEEKNPAISGDEVPPRALQYQRPVPARPVTQPPMVRKSYETSVRASYDLYDVPPPQKQLPQVRGVEHVTDYDTPPLRQGNNKSEFYEVPPSDENRKQPYALKRIPRSNRTSYEEVRTSDIYDHPPPAQEIYDHPPPAQEIYDHPPPAQEIYDHPPPAQEIYDHPPPAQEIYDHPPPAQEIYDQPPTAQEIYDHPPPAQEVYDVPPSTNELYDIPPGRHGAFDISRSSGKYPCDEDETYDDVSALKANHHSSCENLFSPSNKPYAGKNISRVGKRFSEPAISLNAQLASKLALGMYPKNPLRPPNLPPPRNTSKVVGRPVPPPPPQRR